MGDEAGTSYYAYPVAVSSNQNTLRSHKSTLSRGHSRSGKGDDNDISTVALRPIQSSLPSHPSPTVLLLSPYIHPHQSGHGIPLPVYTPNTNQYIPLWDRPHKVVPPIQEDQFISTHDDFTKIERTPYTARQCLIIMAIVFIMAFGAAIFMAVHYGNGYSSL